MIGSKELHCVRLEWHISNEPISEEKFYSDIILDLNLCISIWLRWRRYVVNDLSDQISLQLSRWFIQNYDLCVLWSWNYQANEYDRRFYSTAMLFSNYECFVSFIGTVDSRYTALIMIIFKYVD